MTTALTTSTATLAPRNAVIILNWNGKQDTLECLASVYRIDYPDFRVVVVDNGSADDSVATIKQAYPEAIVLETGSNLGYAGGNNVGIRWALENGFDGILLLNNDTVVDPHLLTAFSKANEQFPDAGVFGAKIYFFSDPDVLWFAGGLWMPEALRFTHVGMGERDGPKFSQPRVFDYLTGCALYARSKVFRDVGLLDENFFLTYEETDWCYRARGRGYKCMFVPDAKLWHKVSASFGGGTSPIVTYFMTRNKLIWAKKHCASAERRAINRQALKLARDILPSFVVSAGNEPAVKRIFWSLASWRNNFRVKLAQGSNRAILYGLRDFWLRRFGDCPAAVRALSNPLHSSKTGKTTQPDQQI